MRRGFTLVEIMIVVAIVALLAAIAIPNLLRARVNANMSHAQAMLRTISTAAESYAAANNGNYPATYGAMMSVTPAYINADYTTTALQGYDFSCTMAISGYSCTANPCSCTTTGTSSYKIETGGVLSQLTTCTAGTCP